MAYVNRLKQTKHTLRSISDSKIKDIEIILVDDFSDDTQRARILLEEFSHLNIKLIDHKDHVISKNHNNPCLAYNIGFRYATGDKIIIQNPECYHNGDILDYVEKNLHTGSYLVFHCYSLDEQSTKNFYNNKHIEFNNQPTEYWDESCWYSHDVFRPMAYHFTSAITREDLNKLGGFDSNFSKGIGFDDDEFLFRIKCLGLNIQYVSDPIVIHQYHTNSFGNITEEKKLINHKLFEITKQNNSFYIKNNESILNDWQLKNIPKIAHFYWDDSALSYLRFLSVYSFAKLNKDWSINVYKSLDKNQNNYNGPCYFNRLREIQNVKIIIYNFNNTPVFNSNYTNKYNYLKWHILSTVGGLWSDFDILYINPINNLIENKSSNSDNVLLQSYTERFSFNTGKHTQGIVLSKPSDNLRSTRSGTQLNPKCIIENYQLLYQKPNSDSLHLLYDPSIIGFHWYGNSSEAVDFEIKFNEQNISNLDNFLQHAYKALMNKLNNKNKDIMTPNFPENIKENYNELVQRDYISEYDYKKIYDKIYTNESLYNDQAIDKINIILEHIDQSKNIKICDIGCGKGHYSRALYKNNYQNIFGIEVSKFCSDNFLSDIPHVNANFLDYSKQIYNHSYDYSLCMDVLEHIDPLEVDNFISEIYRISKNSILGIANHSDIIQNIELHLIQENSEWWREKISKYWSNVTLLCNYNERFFIFKCNK